MMYVHDIEVRKIDPIEVAERNNVDAFGGEAFNEHRLRREPNGFSIRGRHAEDAANYSDT